MPYLKQRPAPFAEMRRLLLGYELDGTALGPIIGRTSKTARARLKNPGDLTLSELADICKRAHIPADEIRAAIKF